MLVKKQIFAVLAVALLTCIFAGEKKEEYVPTLASVMYSDGERRVSELIKALELDHISLKEEDGDGTVYKKRYYCANVCIDLLSDGAIRYLSDVNDADGDDRFLKWLYKGGSAKILSESEFYGFILRNVKNGAVNSEVCIERKSGRVVAARIIFNS